MTSPNCPNANSSHDPDEWEICNDDGFVYKRRRRAHQPPAAVYADVDADLRRHRIARKKKSLLSLKEKYSQELNQWEALSSSFPSSSSSAPAAEVEPTPSAAAAAAPPVLFPAPSKQPETDELLLQAEAQEAVLRKLSEMCDYVDSVCDAEEERFVKELVDLPIWGSPKRLMKCLQSQR